MKIGKRFINGASLIGVALTAFSLFLQTPEGNKWVAPPISNYALLASAIILFIVGMYLMTCDTN